MTKLVVKIVPGESTRTNFGGHRDDLIDLMTQCTETVRDMNPLPECMFDLLHTFGLWGDETDEQFESEDSDMGGFMCAEQITQNHTFSHIFKYYDDNGLDEGDVDGNNLKMVLDDEVIYDNTSPDYINNIEEYYQNILDFLEELNDEFVDCQDDDILNDVIEEYVCAFGDCEKKNKTLIYTLEV